MAARTATKKPAAKKPAPAKKDDPLAAVRADTPDPELTDLDREGEVCAYDGRTAVAKRSTPRGDRFLCDIHRERQAAMGVEVQDL